MNKLARSITKWTKACDKRLNRLISDIHHTSEYRQYCHVGNTAKQCRLGLFQDSDFAGDLEDSKPTSRGTLCIFGSHTFVPISWMCKKQTAVSHSSTESEIISLDTGLRLDGLPALKLWDLVVSVLGNVSRVSDGSGKPESDIHKHHKSHKKIDVMKDIDCVPSNVQSAQQEPLLYVFENKQKSDRHASISACALARDGDCSLCFRQLAATISMSLKSDTVVRSRGSAILMNRTVWVQSRFFLTLLLRCRHHGRRTVLCRVGHHPLQSLTAGLRVK